MSNFLEDTKSIDEKLKIDMPENMELTMLNATFLPYYVDPKSMKLTVVLKRTILPGAYARTGRKMGLVCLSTELPEDKPLTIEEAFNKLNIPTNIQDSIPFGSIMMSPAKSTDASELVLVHIDPPELIDETRGLIYQEPGKYEIGIVEFDSILGAIQENLLQDITTRLLLSELYIMAVEEANKQEQNPQTEYNASAEGMIGDGSNYPLNIDITKEDKEVKTTDIPDDIIEQNKQMDFGAIYSKK